MRIKTEIEKINLPKYVTRKMFDCYEQQIFTICQLYKGEFWKLFLKQSLTFVENSDGKLSNIYLYHAYTKKSAEAEYGIYLEIDHDVEQMKFNEKNELFLLEINSKYYEHTKDIAA